MGGMEATIAVVVGSVHRTNQVGWIPRKKITAAKIRAGVFSAKMTFG